VRTPPAEVEIDAGLIERLLRDQFPELAGPVHVVASGWDNVIARVGDAHCVRMPRRELAAPLVRHEADWLPRLADALPVDVPVAVAVGEPGLGYPWTWLVCPWFQGVRLTDVAVENRVPAASALGAFVSALHRPAPPDAPVSAWRGIALREIAPTVAARLAEVPAAAAATPWTHWDRYQSAPPYDGPPMWLHGDLHPLNVLVRSTSTPTLRAVLDWGDLCCGDPATDLAIAWLAFDERGRAAFRAAAARRHPLDDPIWDRAVGWAVSLGLLFMLDAEPGTAPYGVGEHLLAQFD
jgi:aminoglycoside phosphotransferase (APT) family kinase protein